MRSPLRFANCKEGRYDDSGARVVARVVVVIIIVVASGMSASGIPGVKVSWATQLRLVLICVYLEGLPGRVNQPKPDACYSVSQNYSNKHLLGDTPTLVQQWPCLDTLTGLEVRVRF